jgi:peptidoglycan/xylan/chitin deacetylase (PgdA/CDA1 family)
MSGDPEPGMGSGLDANARRARREQRRREIRTRRRAVLALALVAILVVAVVVATTTGGSSSGSSQGQRATASHGGASSGAAQRSSSPSTAATPTTGPNGKPGTTPVPILMYHVIAPPPAGAPFPGLYVPPEEFSQQMHALASAGWHAVTMDQVAANWSRGAPLPSGKPIVLTFDNGYQSQYTQALPVLRSLGWVGVENIQLSGLPPSQGGFGAGQVQGLIGAGWELDTQGFSHADLVAIGPAALHHEVAESRTVLQQRYHVPVNWFCYPSGHYDATVIAAVRAAGYAGSTTVIPGWAHPGEDPYRLPRLRVLGGTSGTQLLGELASIRSNPPAPPSYTGA